MLEFINMGFPYYGGTVINSYMIHQIPMSRSTLGLGFTLVNLVIGLSAPLVALHILKFGIRKTYGVGSALIFTGSLLLALIASRPWHYLLAFGIVNGLGISFATMVPAAIVATRWFRRYRGRAIGIALSGAGVSGFGVAWFLDKILRTVHGNWRVGWYIVAAAAVISGIIGTVFVRESPESIGQSVDGTTTGEQNPDRPSQTATASHLWTPSEAYRTWAFWLIAIAGLVNTYSTFFFTAHTVLYMHGAGISSDKAAFAMGIFTISMLVGRWVGGLTMDFINARLSYTLALSLILVGSYCYALVNRPDAIAPAYLAAALYGVSHGWVFSCVATMTGNYYGREAFPKLYGTMMLFISAGASPAGYLGGKMFEMSGSYTSAIVLNAALSVVGIAAILFAAVPLPAASSSSMPRPVDPITEPGS
ncbi:MAG TPA: MFS transporter [Acidobacteriaceae bacterium]